MSLLWLIRIILIIWLFAQVIAFAPIIRDRERYSVLLDNFKLNLLLVILYNAVCYAIILLPPDTNVLLPPVILSYALVAHSYNLMGSIMTFLAIGILILTFNARRVVGDQDTGNKLLTTGVYAIARHPIYFGISILCLGLSIASRNFDALIMLPFIFIANYLQSRFEEVYDVGVRFKTQYEDYKKKTKMFGPYWFWILVLIILTLPLVLSLL